MKSARRVLLARGSDLRLLCPGGIEMAVEVDEGDMVLQDSYQWLM